MSIETAEVEDSTRFVVESSGGSPNGSNDSTRCAVGPLRSIQCIHEATLVALARRLHRLGRSPVTSLLYRTLGLLVRLLDSRLGIQAYRHLEFYKSANENEVPFVCLFYPASTSYIQVQVKY